VASNDNVVMLDPKSPEFDTLDQAARGLTDTFDPKAGRERAGAIVKTPAGKYVYTTTIDAGQDHFNMRARFPKDHAFAGIVHNHPGDEDLGQLFSPNDLQTADTLKVPSYVYFDRDQSVRKYVPGTTKTRTMNDPSHPHFNMKVADGDAVAQSDPVVQSAPAAQGSQPSTAEVAVTGQEITAAPQDSGAAWLSSFGPDQPPPGKPAASNQQPATRAGAEPVEVISPAEVKLRQRSGGFLANGKPAPSAAMVDTQGGGGSPQQSPGGTGNAWLDQFGPDHPPEPPPPAPPGPPPGLWDRTKAAVGGAYNSAVDATSRGMDVALKPWQQVLGPPSDKDGPITSLLKEYLADRDSADAQLKASGNIENTTDSRWGQMNPVDIGEVAAKLSTALLNEGGSITGFNVAWNHIVHGPMTQSKEALLDAVQKSGVVPQGEGGQPGLGVQMGDVRNTADALQNVTENVMMTALPFHEAIRGKAPETVQSQIAGKQPIAPPGELESRDASPGSLAERRRISGVQEQPHTILEHAQAIAAAKAAAEGGDKLDQAKAAIIANAEMGAHYDAGAYEGHIATRHAQVAEEAEAQAAQDAEDARTGAFAQFRNSPAGQAAAVSPDEAFAAREREAQAAKDQDYTAALNQRGDQAIERAETTNAGIEKGGAAEPAPTIADNLSPNTLADLQSLKERRAAEVAKGTPDDSPAAVNARIKASTPPEDDFRPLPPNARGAEPAPTPTNRLAAIRAAAEKRAWATEIPQEPSSTEAVQAATQKTTAQPPASLAARRTETATTPVAIFDRLAASRPREVSSLVAKLTPAEAAEHLGRLDDSDVDNAPLRDALQRRAQPAIEPTSETAGMVSLAQRRAAAEAGAAEEGRWQALMSAKPEEAAKLAGEMAPEEAQKHLSRLDAAPGDNAVARKALEDRIETGRSDMEASAHEAATSPKNDLETPSMAQQNAGNFKMGKVDVQGLPISIEHPEGATRPSGQTPRGGHYGYVRGTVDADGMHTDVLLGKHPENENAFVVDHLDPSGQFQQHKLLVGFNNKLSAMRAYRSLFPDNPLGPVSEVKTHELKEWLAKGDTSKPFDAKAVNRLADKRPRFSTAAEKPTHPEDVAHQATSLGDGRTKHVYTYRGGELHAVEDPRAGVTRVERADAGPPSMRGRGIGTSMLERAIAEAHARGQRFESDTRVSGPQQGTYSSLKDRGYEVRENPSTLDRGTDERVSKSPLKGVYEVKPKAGLAARRAQATDHITADAERAQHLTRFEAARTLKPLMDHLNSEGRVGGGVELHQDASTLPDNIQAAMRSGSHDEIRGAYDPDSDTIHLVAGAHTSHADLLRTAVHEIAHKGLSHLFENDAEYTKTMGDVYRGATDRAWLKDYADQHGIDTRTASGRALLADEYAAHLAEDAGKDPGLWQQIVDGIRAGLRKLGVVRDWTDDDIRALVRRATSKLVAHDSAAAQAFREKGLRFADKEDPVSVPNDHPLAVAHKLGKTMEDQANYNPGVVRSRLDWLEKKGISDVDNRLAFLGLRNMKDLNTAALMPDVEKFIRTHDQMSGRRGQIMEDRAETTRQWSRWITRNKEQGKDLGELMHSSTLAGVDPSKPFTKIYTDSTDPAKVSVDDMRKSFHASAKKTYDALDATGKQIFNKVRDDYSQHRQQVFDALERRINESAASDETKKKLMDSLRQKFESGRVQAPYFPLQRFGDHWAAAKDADGNTVSFSRFETTGQKKAWINEMKNLGYEVRGGERMIDKSMAQQINPDFVKKVTEMAKEADPSGELADQIYQEFLKGLPEMSMRKQFVHRIGRLGYSMDAMRAYSYQSFHGSHQLARLEYSSRLDQHIENIKQQAQALNDADPTSANARWGNAVAREMQRRYEWIKNPKASPLASWLTKFGFGWYLGAAPATAFRILSQNPMIASPVLAAYHGQFGATRELSRASAAWAMARGDLADTLRGDERKAFSTARDMGVFSSTATQDLAGASGGANPSGWRSKVFNAMGYLFNAAEHHNRQTTYLAAYRLGRSSGMDHDEAVEHATDRCWDAHFDYNNANRPRVLQNDWMKVAFLFKQYSMGITYRLARDARDMFNNDPSMTPEDRSIARKTLGGMLGRQLLFGGMTGLPLYWIGRGAVNAMLGDEDQPYDMDAALHHNLEQSLGTWAADSVMTGPVGATTGASLSTGASYNDLWYKPPRENENASGWWSDLTGQFMGAIPQLGAQFAQGAQMIHDGQTERGIEHFLPPSLSGLFKAVRYRMQGVTNLSGEQILSREQLSNSELFLQAMGFTPQKVADQYAVNTTLKNVSESILNRKKLLTNQLEQAAAMGDDREINRIDAQIEHFNNENPGEAIGGRGLVRSMYGHFKSAAEAVNGMRLAPGLADLRDRYGGGRVDESQFPAVPNYQSDATREEAAEDANQ
jgi:GNAT superfamily N-acetyltransferase